MRHHDLMGSEQFLHMIREGHEELKRRRDEVNALNVFPVPDGDTGTNMLLTFSAGLEQLNTVRGEQDLFRSATALASGLLMGARGNSGVILSQLFRGFQTAFGRVEKANAQTLAAALQIGVETAYKAVSRPVEGTILTVAREAAQAAQKAAKSKDATLQGVMRAALRTSEQVLARTPDLLLILKQAGVVDSGGQGLVYIYRGFLRALSGEQWSYADPIINMDPLGVPVANAITAVHGEGEYGYCTEFIIILNPSEEGVSEAQIRSTMAQHGDSLLVVCVDQVAKVHVHTVHPGAALEDALAFGYLTHIKIDNMTEQHHEILQSQGLERSPEFLQTQPEPRCSLVVIAAGSGLVTIFRQLGAELIVSDGQTLNPSTEEILQAVDRAGAPDVLLLTNNANVVLAAEQAVRVASNKRLHVIPTGTMSAGLGAAIVFSPNLSAQDNLSAMQHAADRVRSGSITAAVREMKMNEHAINEGDYIGLVDGKILLVDSVRNVVLMQMLARFCDDGAEICTVFTADESLRVEAMDVIKPLRNHYSNTEFEIQVGGQPIYDYLLAAE